ncbi:low-affinity Cu transporter [Saccharomycopsis crataegensis]|uniref:Copper transport protein n=1 Tax=Saccharomycopsis crataegensis TaxID=43959 RepID=A0AAV5QSY7_9ASCO|nr:low-affinity Cu transporter [Saccharomycopsis crataegensis]
MDHHMPDHSMPDHGTMPPGHNHGGANDSTCSANMLFTWEYQDVCVVFEWWHIKSQFQLLASVVAIIALAAGYEFVKYQYKQYSRSSTSFKGLPTPATTGSYANKVPNDTRLKTALFYGVLVGYSFMLMLVFMSFNGWLMGAVVVGAAVGHYIWGNKQVGNGVQDLLSLSTDSLEGESLACH